MSVIGGLRKLGWVGLRKRFEVSWGDLRDWWEAPRRADGRKLGLQPWRKGKKLPRNVQVTILSPRREPSPAVRVGIYDRPGAEHEPPTAFVPHPARKLYHIKDAIVLTRSVIVDRSGRNVLPIRYYLDGTYKYPGLRGRGGDVSLRTPMSRRHSIDVGVPVLVSQAGFLPYGHFLLETVPRLLYLERCPPDTHVLTSVEMTETYWRFFEAMGVPRDRVINPTGPAYCKDVYVPDMLVDVYGAFTDDVWRAFERVGASLTAQAKRPKHERIYVSRRRFKNRALEGEDKIEELFARYGFATIYPEELPIEEQVALFAHARMIAGPRGSGMHHVVFSAPDAQVLLLTPRDTALAVDTWLTRRDDTTAYVMGDAIRRPHMHRLTNPWTIDPALVEQAIKAHFRL